MTDEEREIALNAFLQEVFDEDGSSFETDLCEATDGGFLLNIRGEGNPFANSGHQVIALRSMEATYRSLRSGEVACTPFDDWTGFYQCLRKSYGEFVEIPDDHSIVVWFCPKGLREEGRDWLQKEVASVIASEVETDLWAINHMLEKLADHAPLRGRAPAIAQISNLARIFA